MCQICLLLFTVYNVTVFHLCFDDVIVTVLVLLYVTCRVLSLLCAAAVMVCNKMSTKTN